MPRRSIEKKARNLSMAGLNPIQEELEETGATISAAPPLVLFIIVMSDIPAGDTASRATTG
jgi:hypothetical protein